MDTQDLAERVISTLRAHEPDLRRAGLKRLSVFGSVARGDYWDESAKYSVTDSLGDIVAQNARIISHLDGISRGRFENDNLVRDAVERTTV